MPIKEHFPVEGDPEVLVSSSATTDAVSRMVKRGGARRIGPRLYTNEMEGDPAAIVARNVWPIVAGYCPGAVVVDRSALEARPSPDGVVYVDHERARPVELPALRIVPRRGPGTMEGDTSFIAGLWLASPARALLENLSPSRVGKGDLPRTLGRHGVELWLESRLSEPDGKARVNEMRDRARRLAKDLGLEDELEALEDLIGAMLGTRDGTPVSGVGRARGKGTPFDPDRIELFDRLADHLDSLAPLERSPPEAHDREVFAFFESYFSNFIEGTEFELDEAERIVFDGEVPAERPADARDILGVFQVAVDPVSGGRTPESADELIELIKGWHASVTSARPEVRPGEFKQVDNRVGAYTFVSREKVEGTLTEGFRRYRNLAPGMARATYGSFLISEVHPFADGNGRVARLLMNAELSGAGQQRILIPTVYRDNYLAALRALSRAGRADVLPRVLEFAQSYGRMVDFSGLREAEAALRRTHAFLTETEAEDEGVRLVLPGRE